MAKKKALSLAHKKLLNDILILDWNWLIDWLIYLFIVFNATFSNISAISWQLSKKNRQHNGQKKSTKGQTRIYKAAGFVNYKKGALD
jgi:hypothetical protein